MSELRSRLAQTWQLIQCSLFPWLSEDLGELSIKQQQLISTLELLRLEEYLPYYSDCVGRPPAERSVIARAFIAKAVYNMPTTRILIDRLETDIQIRRICGWERKSDIPGESTFSRAFAELSKSKLLERVQKTFISEQYKDEVVGHISRDSTAIEAREKPEKKVITKEVKKRKAGRPKKGEEVPKKKRRIEKQMTEMSLKEMLDDLPTACNVGSKKNSKGNTSHWIGL